jgi:putative oxidoreductase
MSEQGFSTFAPARLYGHTCRLVSQAIPDWALTGVMRAAMASTFFLSGRTKVEGLLTIKASTFELFRSEYHVPLLPPELAAYMATFAEHTFSALLLLGLFTRLSAMGLICMTAVIEVFVYPDAWPVHLTWAASLLYLAARGGGRASLDHVLRIP